MAGSLCYFRSGLVLLYSYLLMSQFFCYKLLKAEMPKDVRKKLVVQLREALLICQGEKLLLGYKLLSCSLCKMGFSSSPSSPLLAVHRVGFRAALPVVCMSAVVPVWLEEGGAPLPLLAWLPSWLCAQTKTWGLQSAAASGNATNCRGAKPCQGRVQVVC